MDIPWGIIISAIGAVIGLYAIKYARHAWLDPVPLLEFRFCSFRYLQIDSGEYVIICSVTVTNVSGVPAYIKSFELVGIPFQIEQKVNTTVTSKEGEVVEITLYPSFELTSGAILKPGDTKTAEIVTTIGSHPREKIYVKIITPKREFKYCIDKIEEIEKSISVLSSL